MGAIVYIACVVIVPVLLNVFCLMLLLRAACKRLRNGNGPQQASQIGGPTDTKCHKQPAVQGLTHLVVMHPDDQIVCGRMLEQLSVEEKHDRRTEAELVKTVFNNNDTGACTFWVASIPQPTDIEVQLTVNNTEDVPSDSKVPEGDLP